MGLDDIAAECLRVRQGQDAQDPLAVDNGVYSYRKGGERHCWTPESVRALRTAVRDDSIDDYHRFAEMEDNGMFFIRDILRIKYGDEVPLDEVESAESIMRRFVTGAISFGAISKEAHECLAEAMNRIGSQSNTGEGGEDPARFTVQSDGRNLRSAVKQIASGRFGVTAEYLVNADELQIKSIL